MKYILILLLGSMLLTVTVGCHASAGTDTDHEHGVSVDTH